MSNSTSNILPLGTHKKCQHKSFIKMVNVMPFLLSRCCSFALGLFDVLKIKAIRIQDNLSYGQKTWNEWKKRISNYQGRQLWFWQKCFPLIPILLSSKYGSFLQWSSSSRWKDNQVCFHHVCSLRKSNKNKIVNIAELFFLVLCIFVLFIFLFCFFARHIKNTLSKVEKLKEKKKLLSDACANWKSTSRWSVSIQGKVFWPTFFSPVYCLQNILQKETEHIKRKNI